MTTVSNLIEALSKFPPEAKVILAADPEGNLYRDIETPEYPYFVEPSHYGAYDWVMSPEDSEEDEEYSELERAVVIWPS